ncbi:DUF6612 family protein [Chloroflexota bacterium]
MKKGILKPVAIILLLAAVVVGACGPAPLLTAEEVVEKAMKAMESVKDYHTDFNMVVDIEGEAGGEVIDAAITIDGNGAFDVEKQVYETAYEANMEIPDVEAQSFKAEVYMVEDMTYVKTSMQGTVQWLKAEIESEAWENDSFMEQQLGLLEGAQLELLGEEEIEGEVSYGIKVTPDLEKLWLTMMNQQGVQQLEIALDLLQDIITAYSVEIWIAKDTFRITKAAISMDTYITPEIMGVPDEEGYIKYDMFLGTTFYDFNKGVSVVLPDDAEEAIEVPSLN